MLPAYHGTDRTSVLDRFDVSLAFDIETAQQILETLNASLSQRNDAEDGPRVQALVIDSLTPLLGPHLSATSSQGLRDLNDNVN